MSNSHEVKFNEGRDIRINALDYTNTICRTFKCKLSDICERINRSHSYFTSFRNFGFMHRKDVDLLEKLYGIPAAPYITNSTEAHITLLEDAQPCLTPVQDAQPTEQNKTYQNTSDQNIFFCTIENLASTISRIVYDTIMEQFRKGGVSA